MITREKLRIYENYDGDIDAWARASTLQDKNSITDQDWHSIDQILQSLLIVQSGLASADFESQVLARTMDVAEDEYVRERLCQLSSGGFRGR
jgi:hypothetical protein